MAITSNRTITITQSGEIASANTFSAAANTAAPGDIDLLTLASGFNTITLPLGGSTVRGATIIPPAGNTQTLTLKGVTGDTGILIHKTDPTSISFDAGVTTFGITAGGTVTGLRVIYT